MYMIKLRVYRRAKNNTFFSYFFVVAVAEVKKEVPTVAGKVDGKKGDKKKEKDTGGKSGEEEKKNTEKYVDDHLSHFNSTIPRVLDTVAY